MHSSLRYVPVAAGALLPAMAYANAGIGLLSPSLIITVPGLVPAIVVEAIVYGRTLGMGLRSALVAAAIANVVSTAVGGGISIAFDVVLVGGGPEPSTALFAGVLVPMFFLSWWIEAGLVRGQASPAARPRVTRAAGLANAITYAVMALVTLFVVPAPAEVPSRERMARTVELMFAARAEIAAHHERERVFPPARALPAEARFLRSLRRDADGRVVALFAFPARPDADGRSLVMAPRMQEGRIAGWDCYTPDMPFKYLPADCRQRAPERR
jgi:hypothetical protein